MSFRLFTFIYTRPIINRVAVKVITINNVLEKFERIDFLKT